MNIRQFGFLVMMFCTSVSLVGCGRIETGFVGIRTDFNKKVDTSPMNPGFYTAWLSNVDEYVVKEVEVELNNLTPKGKDNLSLRDFDISVFYQVNPADVGKLAIKYTGMSPKNKENGFYYPSYMLVERTVRGVTYDVVSNFDSLTMHQRRSMLEKQIFDGVQVELDKFDSGSFKVTKVIIRSILTDPALEQSIQQAVQMQKQTEAKQAEIELAKAEAKRKLVEAEGQASANKTIADSLTSQYLRYKEIEAQALFAKQGTHTVVFGNPQGSLVNIK